MQSWIARTSVHGALKHAKASAHSCAPGRATSSWYSFSSSLPAATDMGRHPGSPSRRNIAQFRPSTVTPSAYRHRLTTARALSTPGGGGGGLSGGGAGGPSTPDAKLDRWSAGTSGFLSSSKQGGKWKEGPPVGKKVAPPPSPISSPLPPPVSSSTTAVDETMQDKERTKTTLSAAETKPASQPCTFGVKSGAESFLNRSRSQGEWVVGQGRATGMKNFRVKVVRGGRLVGQRPPGFSLHPTPNPRKGALAKVAKLSAIRVVTRLMFWGIISSLAMIVIITIRMFSDIEFRRWLDRPSTQNPSPVLYTCHSSPSPHSCLLTLSFSLKISRRMPLRANLF